MALPGIFQYLRLKIIVTLLRVMIGISAPSRQRRDRALIPKGAQQERIKIPSRDSGRCINGDLYYPPGHSSSSPGPVLVNWHGSGFCLPLLGNDALFCARIAHETGIVVLDADYRKGPEVSFPGPLNDVEDALRWVARDGRFDATRVAVSGFSAGGTLSLVAASTLRQKLAHIIDIHIVVSFYPLTDMTVPPMDRKVPHPIKPHPLWALEMFHDCYCPDKDLRADPMVSPAFANPAHFPPKVAFFLCDGDTLMPEALALAERLEGTTEVVTHISTAVPHGFDNGAEAGTREWDQREEAYALTIKLLKEALHG